VLVGCAARLPCTQPGGRGENHAGQIHRVEPALDEDDPLEQAAASKTTGTIAADKTRRTLSTLYDRAAGESPVPTPSSYGDWAFWLIRLCY
jgi:hypothetical protein